MDNTVKYIAIGGGVIIGGLFLMRILDMMVSPQPVMGLNQGFAGGVPGAGLDPNTIGSRAGESDVSAIGRIFERAIDRVGEGYQTYTREVAQTNRERDRTRGAANDDAARQAKLRAGARS
jgi:hypothetical protein